MFKSPSPAFTLLSVLDRQRPRPSVEQLADIPEETIWLQNQKSARTRRAYRLDVQHFMRTLGITTPAELRKAGHKAVIAWERYTGKGRDASTGAIERPESAQRHRRYSRGSSTLQQDTCSVGYTGVRDERPTPPASKTDCTNSVLALL